MPIDASFGGFLGAHFPKTMSLIVLSPKKDRPWDEARHLSHKARISVSRFELGVGTRKKDRTGKKSQNGYIPPICGEAPTEAMYIKICLVDDILDVIKCVKFPKKIFRGYNFTECRIFYFPIDF